MKILIIEDNPADANLAKEYILDSDSENIDISVAEDLQQAVDLLNSRSFDVLLTDLNLPDASGDETFKTISRIAPALPIVILSGNDDEEKASALVAEGAQDYLIKADFNANTIRRALRYAIERKSLVMSLEEKNFALAQAQEKLIYAAKLESTGQIAAGVAHEVKNPLAVIQLGLESLMAFNEKNPDRDETEAKILGRIQTALDRATGIINELLDFSSDTAFEWEYGNINQTIERAISLIAPQLEKSDIAFETFFTKKLPLIRMDRLKIEQSVINLMINASHALETVADKKIQIKTDPVCDDTGEIVSVRITVEDSGPGIEPEDKPKIFDAFYTTKEPGKGTGLGMTVVQSIIKFHSGTIQLNESELGGLRVEMTLPVTYHEDLTS